MMISRSLVAWFGLAVLVSLPSQTLFAEAFYNYQSYRIGQVRKGDRMYYCDNLRHALEIQRVFSGSYSSQRSHEEMILGLESYEGRGCYKTKGFTHMVLRTLSKAAGPYYESENYDGAKVMVSGEPSVVESLLIPSGRIIYVITYAMVPDPAE